MCYSNTIRTAGSEWPFGHLQELFPYICAKKKQKLYSTIPDACMSVAMILSNIVNLMKGRENHIYFDLPRAMTPEQYIGLPHL